MQVFLFLSLKQQIEPVWSIAPQVDETCCQTFVFPCVLKAE